jgi:hypothetical protein
MTRAVFGVMLVAAGCVAIRPHTSVKTPPDRFGGSVSPTPAQRMVAETGATGATDRVCRANSRRDGWIAIDYVSDSLACPRAYSRTRNAVALVVKYDGFAIGAELDVCSDERIPSNWTIVRAEPGDGRCADGPSLDNKQERVKVIQRVR